MLLAMAVLGAAGANISAETPDVCSTCHSMHLSRDGRLILSNYTGNSYCFLMGVRGYESPDWEENVTSGSHNEYFGLAMPIEMRSCQGIRGCYSAGGGVRPPDGTISQFCGTCHNNFHTLGQEGVGENGGPPIIRHPTDLALPAGTPPIPFITPWCRWGGRTLFRTVPEVG
jgi:hypothetical protein